MEVTYHNEQRITIELENGMIIDVFIDIQEGQVYIQYPQARLKAAHARLLAKGLLAAARIGQDAVKKASKKTGTLAAPTETMAEADKETLRLPTDVLAQLATRQDAAKKKPGDAAKHSSR